MCLIITAFAAVIATLVWYFVSPGRDIKLGWLALAYWGASLMWTVDGFFALGAGEPFLDLSANDALLGLVIVLCGLVVWTLSLLARDPRRIISALKKA